MATCRNCGSTFDEAQVREAYNEVLDGEGDYDTDDGGSQCFDCAIPAEAAGAIDTGRAILMMNGEEPYDEEHVQNYL